MSIEHDVTGLGGTVELGSAGELHGVFLPLTRVTDDQVSALARLPRVEELHLTSTYYNSTRLAPALLDAICAQPRWRTSDR